MSSAKQMLQKEAAALSKKAVAAKIDSEIVKASGSCATVLGLLASATTVWGSVFALIGGITWGLTTLRERERTKRLRPTFLEFSFEDLLRSVAQDSESQSRPLKPFDWLCDEDKAVYYLCTDFLEPMSIALEGLSEEDQRTLLLRAAAYLEDLYLGAFRHGQSYFIQDTPPEIYQKIAEQMVLTPARLMLENRKDEDEPEAEEEPFVDLTVDTCFEEESPVSDEELLTHNPESVLVAATERDSEDDTGEVEEGTEENPLTTTSVEGEIENLTAESFNLKMLFQLPFSLLWGGQGSGKTSLANYLVSTCVANGWIVKVGDPHYSLGDWDGVEVWGKKLNYAECDELILEILELVKVRYEERADFGTRPEEFTPAFFLLEEFTSWAGQCKHSAALIESAVQAFRKVNIHLVVVSHGKTLIATGNAKGMSETFARGSLQLNLEAEIREVEQEDGTIKMLPRPTGFAKLRVYGEQRGEVAIPDTRSFSMTKETNPALRVRISGNKPEATPTDDLVEEDPADSFDASVVVGFLNWFGDRSSLTDRNVTANKSMRALGLGKKAAVIELFEALAADPELNFKLENTTLIKVTDQCQKDE